MYSKQPQWDTQAQHNLMSLTVYIVLVNKTDVYVILVLYIIYVKKIKCWFQVSNLPVENTTDHKHFIDIF